MFLSTQWDNSSLVSVGPPGQSARPGEDRMQASPSSRPLLSLLLPPFFLEPFLGGFYHIKMFGLMGLTRLLGGMKKGPLFPAGAAVRADLFLSGSSRLWRSQEWAMEVWLVG